MIQTSQAYREAIVGSPREIELFAVVDISDPDKKYLPTTCSPEVPWSKKEELHNYDLTSPPRYMTGERGRTLLNGTFDLFPDDYSVPDEVGYAGKALSDSIGTFSAPFPFAQINISGVRILQGYSFFFSGDPVDGVPCDFTVEVIQGQTAYFTQEVTGNYQSEVSFRGFVVYSPDAVRLTVKRWTIPHRLVRLVEVVTGLFERWTGDDLASFSATLQGQFSCLSLPYGSVNLAMDNGDRRFEPRKKDSFFQSIEERQGVELYIGCKTADRMERIKLGVFYQSGDGWKTSSNEMTMQWYLVDIIGLVSNRTFIPPDVLPTTLGGWLKAVVTGNIPGMGVASGPGNDGVNGQGGKIWYGVIDINEEQEFDVHLGAGGAPGIVCGQAGSLGEHTTFGMYSSESGQLYPNGYTDIANGQSFARTGVPAPMSGTGDGGKGGEGGSPGAAYWKQLYYPDGRPRGWDLVVVESPGKGNPGVAGATGFVMVTWDKPKT